VIFTETVLPGAFVIDPEPAEDARGLFARTWCEREYAVRGLVTRISQCSTSFNKRKGTLRGLHYQLPPAVETKIVRCTRGALYDVIVDLRPDSPTFLRHVATVLTADNRRMVYVPAGLAHGFQTLDDGTEVFYQISEFFAAEHARGVRWDDPIFGISWPVDEVTILERDRRYPDFSPAEVTGR
jgi:dTDP-4-dehydrorhamnose 3,5-epimerase